MLIKVYSGAVYGIEAQTIRIECLVGPGIRYHMIGLPDPSIRESWQRIETALNSSGFRMPRQKIVVNLAPAYLRKGGSAFDLAIAVGISLASKQVRLPQAIDRILFLGELSLDGSLRPIRGALSIAQMAEASGFEVLVLPKENAMEARVVENMRVIGVNNLKKVLSLLQNEHAFSERTASDASQK